MRGSALQILQVRIVPVKVWICDQSFLLPTYCLGHQAWIWLFASLIGDRLVASPVVILTHLFVISAVKGDQFCSHVHIQPTQHQLHWQSTLSSHSNSSICNFAHFLSVAHLGLCIMFHSPEELCLSNACCQYILGMHQYIYISRINVFAAHHYFCIPAACYYVMF